MKLKVEHGKKKVLENLKSISNNVVVNNFIFELINHGSITNFFYDENTQAYVFENKKKEKIFVYLRPKQILLNSCIDEINQQFEFNKNIDGSSSIYLNISTNIEWPNHMQKRTICLDVLYDYNNKITSYKINTNNIISEFNLNNKIYENYNIEACVYLLNDILIKKETINYLHDYEKNNITYYFAEYDEKSFNDVCSFVKPKFYEITKEEYEFQKNGAQKVKTMV